MRTDRWNAGIALMKSTNPKGWATLADEMNLVEPNHVALNACREAAAKLKKSQPCTDRCAGAGIRNRAVSNILSTETPDGIIDEFQRRLGRDGLAGFVTVDINPAEGGGLSIDRIMVDEQERGRGVANRIVRIFVQLCDDYAQEAEVIPKPLDEQTTQEGLERLYLRHGFVRVSANESRMRRHCQTPAPAS